MKLGDAAAYFDRLVFTDAYTGATLFKGQFDLYDGSKRDGLPTERRTFSTSASVAMPARGVVAAGGRQWIVGGSNPDFFDDSQIRAGYVVNKAEGLATIRTLSQAIAGTGGSSAYAARSWLKETKEVAESSGVFAQYELIFAPSEQPAANTIVTLAGRPHFVRSAYAGQAGFAKALADELPDTFGVTLTWNLTAAVDPVTELFVGGTVATVPALTVRWQNSFQYPSAASPKFVPGDIVAITRAADGAPATGSIVTLHTAAWRVLAIAPVDDCLRLHLRRV